MKQKIIKAGVLTAVFIAALILFSVITNRGNADLTVAMEAATLPTISFETEGYPVNTLAGYKKEMEIPAMRDTITPLDEQGNVKVNIQAYDAEVKKLTYEVYPLDGSKVLFEKTEKVTGDTLTLEPGSVLEADVEGVLKVTLTLAEDEKVSYYTRIVNPQDFHVKECLDFTKTLHHHMMNKETNEVTRYMEPNAEGDNGTLQHVTIHSAVEQATWGQLNPEVTGDIQWDIKETNETYTSVLLKYEVACMQEGEETEQYRVQEFFKVRKFGEKYYLLVYDRIMNEVFEPASQVLTNKGIDLGIVSGEQQYEVAADGNMVAFVRERELWCYDREEDSLSLVFSFSDSEKEDLRNEYDQHDIRIVSMEKNGNLTFMVYGYMNRGHHEGEVGVAFYHYHHEHSSVTEKAFISSDKSFAVAADELCRMVYYNVDMESLYVLTDGVLRRTVLEGEGSEVIAEGLTEEQYVLSEDGHLLAYRKDAEVAVLNMSTGETQSVKAESGETIRPLGFVGEDFVYGLNKAEHQGMTVSGDTIVPMHRLEIRDKENEVVKIYQEDGIYIADAFIADHMVTLKRVKKSGQKYKEVSEDYITNNEERAESNISLEAYTTTVKQRQYRLEFADRIEDKNPKILKTKQVYVEKLPTMNFESSEAGNCFYVYGAGKMFGIYDKAGYAVQEADKKEGVVVSASQTYVWERGNQEAWYQISGLKGQKRSGESTLEACLRLILEYEGKDMPDMTNLSPLEVLEQYSGGEGLDLTGCSASDLCYMVGKGTPVVAMTGTSDGVLLIGYYSNTIVYMDPSDGKIKTCTPSAMDEKTEDTGHTYLGYAKAPVYE